MLGVKSVELDHWDGATVALKGAGAGAVVEHPAGGGGFLMLFCPGNGQALEDYMTAQQMPRLRYGIDRHGSRVLGAAA